MTAERTFVLDAIGPTAAGSSWGICLLPGDTGGTDGDIAHLLVGQPFELTRFLYVLLIALSITAVLSPLLPYGLIAGAKKRS